jgi:hypothetical protein
MLSPPRPSEVAASGSTLQGLIDNLRKRGVRLDRFVRLYDTEFLLPEAPTHSLMIDVTKVTQVEKNENGNDHASLGYNRRDSGIIAATRDEAREREETAWPELSGQC